MPVDNYNSKGLSYEQLAELINTFTPEQKKQTVTFKSDTELFSINAVDFSEASDVLDDGHPYLLVY